MKILIYSNSKTFGGVETIIERYIQYLKKNHIEFILIEDKGTKLSNIIGHAHCFSVDDIKIEKYDAIFFPNICKILDDDINSLNYDCPIFGWVVHPNELFTSFFLFNRKIFRFLGYKVLPILRLLNGKKFNNYTNMINFLIENKSLCFMDKVCVDTTNFFYPKMKKNNIKIIPVPVDFPIKTIDNNVGDIESIYKFGYFGRMDKMKYSALKGVIEENISAIKKSELHVVGDGDYLSSLKKLCKINKVEFISYGYQSNKKAKQILKNNTQVCLAMGISALDLASESIPCIMIDPSMVYNFKNQKKFKTVSQIEGYSLGEYRDYPRYKRSHYDFDAAIALAVSSSEIKKSINYVVEHHNPTVIFDQITESIFQSKISLSLLKKKNYF